MTSEWRWQDSGGKVGRQSAAFWGCKERTLCVAVFSVVVSGSEGLCDGAWRFNSAMVRSNPVHPT